MFPDVYKTVTDLVRQSVSGAISPGFLEPRWISRLTGIFCSYYVDALERDFRGRTQPSDAWGIAFRYSRNPRRLPAIEAILGINAHINFDLALGIDENIRAFGRSDEAMLERYRRDHFAVNDLLRVATKRSLRTLRTAFDCPLAQTTSFIPWGIELATCWIMNRVSHWRSNVWSDVCALQSASSTVERDAIVNKMNQRSATIGRGFLSK